MFFLISKSAKCKEKGKTILEFIEEISLVPPV